MEFFPRQTHIDFMGIRKWTALFSILAVSLCISLLTLKGLRFGLDFTGGTQIELRYSQPILVETVQQQLRQGGFSEAKVTQYGSSQDVLVKLANKETVTQEALTEHIQSLLSHQDPKLQVRRVEFIGAEVGERLAQQGALAVLIALLATMIYIAVRFDYRFGLSAALALLHDPILILGAFSYFQIEFDLSTLAAILAVLGYSLNDTIVVYDRVRENFRKVRKGSPIEIMNLSINQTLSRTTMTSAMTLLVVIALYIFGGESLHGFSVALIIGIVVGTYSSIFIAGALAIVLGLDRTALIPSLKKVVDNLP